MPEFKNEVLKTINKYNLISDNDKIVVRRFRRAGLYLPFRYFKKLKTRKNI